MTIPKSMIAKHLDRLTDTIDTIYVRNPSTDPLLIIKAILTAEHTLGDLISDMYKPSDDDKLGGL